MRLRQFKLGDPVVFAKDKWSTCPGPRAHEVYPARSGDGYAYKVDKFYRVLEDEQDGRVTLITRKGRVHIVDVSDPRLHRASPWQRLRYRNRFPDLDELADRQQHAPQTAPKLEGGDC